MDCGATHRGDGFRGENLGHGAGATAPLGASLVRPEPALTLSRRAPPGPRGARRRGRRRRPAARRRRAGRRSRACRIAPSPASSRPVTRATVAARRAANISRAPSSVAASGASSGPGSVHAHTGASPAASWSSRAWKTTVSTAARCATTSRAVHSPDGVPPRDSASATRRATVPIRTGPAARRSSSSRRAFPVLVISAERRPRPLVRAGAGRTRRAPAPAACCPGPGPRPSPPASSPARRCSRW